MKKKVVILASSSPRRKEILSSLGISFTTAPSSYDEKDVMEDAYKTILHHAREKARDVASKICEGDENYGKEASKDYIIIGSDTAVVLDGKIIGKPNDEKDAIMTLRKLSGREHEVVSSLCIIEVKNLGIVSEMHDYDVAVVKFKELSQDEIINYVNSLEPMDKAGAYAIQGKAKSFIEYIKGDYYTIVGFPVELFKRMWKYYE